MWTITSTYFFNWKIWIWRDNSSRCEINSFAWQIATKSPLFALESLSERTNWILGPMSLRKTRQITVDESTDSKAQLIPSSNDGLKEGEDEKGNTKGPRNGQDKMGREEQQKTLRENGTKQQSWQHTGVWPPFMQLSLTSEFAKTISPILTVKSSSFVPLVPMSTVGRIMVGGTTTSVMIMSSGRPRCREKEEDNGQKLPNHHQTHSCYKRNGSERGGEGNSRRNEPIGNVQHFKIIHCNFSKEVQHHSGLRSCVALGMASANCAFPLHAFANCASHFSLAAKELLFLKGSWATRRDRVNFANVHCKSYNEDKQKISCMHLIHVLDSLLDQSISFVLRVSSDIFPILLDSATHEHKSENNMKNRNHLTKITELKTGSSSLIWPMSCIFVHCLMTGSTLGSNEQRGKHRIPKKTMK